MKGAGVRRLCGMSEGRLRVNSVRSGIAPWLMPKSQEYTVETWMHPRLYGAWGLCWTAVLSCAIGAQS